MVTCKSKNLILCNAFWILAPTFSIIINTEQRLDASPNLISSFTLSLSLHLRQELRSCSRGHGIYPRSYVRDGFSLKRTLRSI